MSGEQKLAVLRDVSFTIPQGAFVAIVGPSGSGKTTLLGLLAGLETPTRGTVVLDGSDLTTLSENDRARLRGEKVGFVNDNYFIKIFKRFTDVTPSHYRKVKR